MKEKTSIKNLSVLFLLIAVTVVWLGFIGLLAYLSIKSHEVPMIRSLSILTVFLIAVFALNKGVSWKKSGIILVFITSIFGASMDYLGNDILNKPLEWIVSGIGELQTITESETYGSTTSSNYYFYVVDSDGTVIQEINFILIIIFRFFEYLIIYSILLSVVQPLFMRLRGLKKHPTYHNKDNSDGGNIDNIITGEAVQIVYNTKTVTINNELKEEVLYHIRSNNIIKAIKIVKDNTTLNLQEAKDFVDSLREEAFK